MPCNAGSVSLKRKVPQNAVKILHVSVKTLCSQINIFFTSFEKRVTNYARSCWLTKEDENLVFFGFNLVEVKEDIDKTLFGYLPGWMSQWSKMWEKVEEQKLETACQVAFYEMFCYKKRGGKKRRNEAIADEVGSWRCNLFIHSLTHLFIHFSLGKSHHVCLLIVTIWKGKGQVGGTMLQHRRENMGYDCYMERANFM